MNKRFTWGGMSLCLFAALALIVTGCSQSDNKGGQAKDSGKQVAHKDDDGHDHGKAKEGHGHGWWCDDHGIPEEECSMCQAKAEKEAKAKGDRCEKHERALSQCFHCKPERREFYAAKYRAKYGKKPPPIPEFDEKKGDGKKKE